MTRKIISVLGGKLIPYDPRFVQLKRTAGGEFSLKSNAPSHVAGGF